MDQSGTPSGKQCGKQNVLYIKANELFKVLHLNAVYTDEETVTVTRA